MVDIPVDDQHPLPAIGGTAGGQRHVVEEAVPAVVVSFSVVTRRSDGRGQNMLQRWVARRKGGGGLGGITGLDKTLVAISHQCLL